GLDWTLKSVREMTSGKVVIVFGTDGDRDPSKREDLAEVAARRADILWVTDENPRTEDPQSIRDYLIRGVKRVRPDMNNVT
ncbi:cyanophycin synthetase, partial [Pauljensenia sp. UMB6358]